MTIIEDSADTVLAEVDANEVIDTAQLTGVQGVKFNRKGFIVKASDGTVEASIDGTDGWETIPVGADEPFVQGQAFRYVRVTENATVQFFLP